MHSEALGGLINEFLMSKSAPWYLITRSNTNRAHEPRFLASSKTVLDPAAGQELLKKLACKSCRKPVLASLIVSTLF